MTGDAGRRARDRLLSEVGAFFCNTRRSAETCVVCTGPAAGLLCPQCRVHREMFGDRLADLVVPLTYVQGRTHPRHQSEHHVFSYKANRPAPKCMRDLLLMVFAATTLHGGCIARSVGSHWDAVTFVPSLARPGRDHTRRSTRQPGDQPILEDRATDGAKAQSVAVALKDVGAGAVSVLAVARWLRYDWPDHRALIEDLRQPYDAFVCPVAGGLCTGS